MEPWLDSLSEDWNSEHNSTSLSLPHSTTQLTQHGSTISDASQRQTPHLTQNNSKWSSNGRYLHSRSLRTTSALKGSPVLVEQNPSKFNVTAHKSAAGNTESQKKRLVTTLPRRASGALSDSAQSVQHYTLHKRSTSALDGHDIPEWKRRLARGEDVAGDACDLFGPSRLEDIFRAPPTSYDENQKPTACSLEQPILWSIPSNPSPSSTFNQFQSMKATRSKLQELDIVEEVNEEVDTKNVGELAAPRAYAHDFMEQRIISCELSASGGSEMVGSKSGTINATDNANFAQLQQEARTRTTSEQEELKNEWISPITLSIQNTIRDRAIKDSLQKSPSVSEAKLEQPGIDNSQQPSFCSRDQEVVFGQSNLSGDESTNDETAADVTSQSLPDDLSMGTEEFISRGGFINKRRGGHSNEGSFHMKNLSAINTSSGRSTFGPLESSISHSSPYIPVSISKRTQDPHIPKVTSPVTSPSFEEEQQNVRSFRGSPLKLFGYRDTYTNSKLLRVLSHFEDANSGESDDAKSCELVDKRVEGELRMSQFGQGELDQYDFVQDVKLKPLDTAQGNDHDSQLFVALVYSDAFEGRPLIVARDQSAVQTAAALDKGTFEVEIVNTDQWKRSPKSPLKERTPKRRRTLLPPEIEVFISQQLENDNMIPRSGSSKLAGMKRKDARYDEIAPAADPESLAGRLMLRPRTTHRRTSHDAPNASTGTIPVNFKSHTTGKLGYMATRAAVAEEVVQAVREARKTSVTTQDYMEEATKIMQMIRAKGKPKSSLASVEKPGDGSGMSPKAEPDMHIDEISSGDEFSRPPSRNGGRDLREQRRKQHYDPKIASHLRKFKESDDLELLIETSALEPVSVPDHAQAEEASLVPIPEDEQQSSPPNIRIRDNSDMQSKRKHPASTIEYFHTSGQPIITSMNSSSTDSTQRTVPTSSTSGSGRKGVINPGKVKIPDQVGAMTFDHTTKTWIKERKAGDIATAHTETRQTTSEEDPFEHISDLSTEALHDTDRKKESHVSDISRPSTQGSPFDNELASCPKIDSRVMRTGFGDSPTRTRSHTVVQSQSTENESRIHNGRISCPPKSPEYVNKQPRVVTIAFSSPLVSAVAYQNDASSFELEFDVDAHVSEGFQLRQDTGNGNSGTSTRTNHITGAMEQTGPSSSLYKPYPARKFVGRPVSRIEEQGELSTDEEMSLIPTNKSQGITPAPRRTESILAVPNTTGNTSSIICLTPLSDFSLHQVDRPLHKEASFIAPRSHPTALRQAHGSLALGLDDMMKAITDVEPFEPYWDHIRRLDLTGRYLTSLHRLEEYCATLEELTITTNELTQLNGVPLSIRMLNVQRNHLSNMTSWGHLQNLQYLNISGNELESLEGLSCLYHLRELNANDNKISDIDGILDLNGLQGLALQGNRLESLDFEGGELTRLTRLDASRNQLTHVHSLSWLPALEDLNLEQNNLREFATSETAALISLRYLHISSNKLRSINLSMCPGIESLYIDENKVTEIRGLDHARHLHTLSLREQTDSPDIVGHVLSMPNDCRKIFLSSNSVPGGKLGPPSQPLFSLRYLELASCGISSLTAGFGCMIPNCRVLNLNFNALGSISHLQGILHLNKLMLAGNRLDRLRRSCLALSRHPALAKLDLRNNPLTVGFYSLAPAVSHFVAHNRSRRGLAVLRDPYALPEQVKDVDDKWMTLMDEGTRLRRRTIELLLAQKCLDLVELDGLPFDREMILQVDGVWETLTDLGILKRLTTLPQRSISASEKTETQNHVRTGRRGEERSLTVNE
jgi:Leucine-rich repeat (LRR) protein